MKHSIRNLYALNTLWLTAALLSLASDAWAGPGGIIKAAASTPFGRVVLGILFILLSPFIISYLIKRALQIRKTRKDLALLATIHPQYKWLDVKDRTTATLQWVWSAWGEQKMEKSAAFTTEWYRINQQMFLDDWARIGQENVCRLHRIKNISPLFVQHNAENNGEGSRIVLDINLRVTDYLKDIESGKVVEGDKKIADMETIWTLVWNKGEWRLNLIESAGMEWSYLTMPNELPAELSPTPQRI